MDEAADMFDQNHGTPAKVAEIAARVETKPPAPTPGTEMIYALCIGRNAQIAACEEQPGFERHHCVSARVIGELSVLSIVLEASYLRGEAAEERLADLAWVAPRAVRHEEILRSAMRCGPILPLPFGTVFSSVLTMHRAIAPHSDASSSYLDRVEGCVEMGIRIALDREAAKRASREELESALPAALTPGARYLAMRRAGDQSAKLLDSIIARRCAAVIGEIEPFTRGVVARRASADRGDALETAGLYAALVDDTSVEAFCERVESLSGEYVAAGLMVQATGPWAPYSFCPSLGASA